MAGRERRVQGHAGVGDAEGGRPDQPHAVAAADAQQFHAGRAVQARRDHHQGPDPPLPALLGDTGHGSRRRGDDHQVDLFGQRGGRRHARDAVHLGHARVDRVDRAGEVAGGDVLQDGPPDGAGGVETQVEIVRGHLAMHVPHRAEVAGPRGPDLDRRAVGQQSVGTGLDPCAHVALRGSLRCRSVCFRDRSYAGAVSKPVHDAASPPPDPRRPRGCGPAAASSNTVSRHMARQPDRTPSAAAIGTVIAPGRLEAVMYCTCTRD